VGRHHELQNGLGGLGGLGGPETATRGDRAEPGGQALQRTGRAYPR
jgi:hypothetical protein